MTTSPAEQMAPLTPEQVAELREAAEAALRGWIGINPTGSVYDAVGRFNRIANPATIIALLDGYEARGKEVERLANFLRLRDRQAETSKRFWMRAAEAALAGDTRELRNRVELVNLGHVEIIQSEAGAALRKSEERAAELEKALEPFAKAASSVFSPAVFRDAHLTPGDFRIARATLTKDQPDAAPAYTDWADRANWGD